jgi:hypothetical protein
LPNKAVPFTCTFWEGLATPIPTFPAAVIFNIEVPVEEFTWKALLEPVPCTKKLTEEDVALTPATVPLSIITPFPKTVDPVQRATYPFVPVPVCREPPNKVEVDVQA